MGGLFKSNGFEDSQLEAACDGVCAVAGAENAEDPAYGRFDGFDADAQIGCDLFVCVAEGDSDQKLDVAIGESFNRCEETRLMGGKATKLSAVSDRTGSGQEILVVGEDAVGVAHEVAFKSWRSRSMIGLSSGGLSAQEFLSAIRTMR